MHDETAAAIALLDRVAAPPVAAAADSARAMLFNGLGRYDAAHDAARRAFGRDDEALASWALAELIEASVRSHDAPAAVAAFGQLRTRTQLSGTDWSLGVEARSRALISDGATAEGLYREAISRLWGSSNGIERARAHLLYGEWLRRQGRRVDARKHLRTAQRQFTDAHMDEFADRASRELLATGETVRKRSVDTFDVLTPQEDQIAQLASRGHTNAEIGTQLFISARTVEWHLRKVFTKLGITSRRKLPGGLHDPGRTVLPN